MLFYVVFLYCVVLFTAGFGSCGITLVMDELPNALVVTVGAPFWILFTLVVFEFLSFGSKSGYSVSIEFLFSVEELVHLVLQPEHSQHLFGQVLGINSRC